MTPVSTMDSPCGSGALAAIPDVDRPEAGLPQRRASAKRKGER